MPTPRGRLAQTANMYRKIDANAASSNDSYLNDERFDAITERVIVSLDTTPVEDWTTQQWHLFRNLWADRKMKRRLTEQDATAQMTVEQLQELMNSADP